MYTYWPVIFPYSTLLLSIAIQLFKCDVCNYITSWQITIFCHFWFLRKHLITGHSNWAVQVRSVQLHNFMTNYIFFCFFWYWRKHLITEHSNPGIQVWCVQLQCRLQFFWFFWYLRNHHITEYSYWVVQVWFGQLHCRLQNWFHLAGSKQASYYWAYQYELSCSSVMYATLKLYGIFQFLDSLGT